MLFRCNLDFERLILQWLISAPRFYFAAERKELFLTLVNDDQAAVVPGMMAYCFVSMGMSEYCLHFTHGAREGCI